MRGSGWLGVDIGELRSSHRSEELVRARELLMLLGVERYGLKVKDLARWLRKSPDGMTQAVARAARRRTEDRAFRMISRRWTERWLPLGGGDPIE